MRGMLVHYLIERGFGYEDARAVANAVRVSLGKAELVRKKDMVQLVGKAIRKGFGPYEAGDLIFWERQPTTIVVEGKSGSRPFPRSCCRIPFRRLGCLQIRATRLHRRLKPA